MSDEYLWDGTETPRRDDEDVLRLERLLAPLRTPLPPAPSLPQPRTTRYAGIRFLVPALAAAAVIVLMLGATWRNATTAPSALVASWEVAALDGQPRVGSTPVADTGRLAVGQTLATDARSRARLDVSSIGQVTVDANTRLRLVATREGRHELALDHGTLHAFITAPPGQFVVNTPSSTATDLGCVYTLHVDENGSGVLSVTAGWVAFEHNGRESFVPAGASSRTSRATGPGTPRYDDASDEFRRALDTVDSDGGGPARSAALTFVLEHARERDAMTLWHLIPRVDGRDRPAVVDALAARAPMPDDVSRDAILQLDGDALDRWWNALGLQDATWWRRWKGLLH